MKFEFFFYFLRLLAGWLVATSSLAQPLAAQVPQVLQYRILEDQPHDRGLFTQGLLVQGEHLVETSGGYGESLIRRYRTEDGALVNQTELPAQVFAEGVAQVGQQLHLLTWRKGLSFLLDAKTLKITATREYEGEGWGLTYDGRHLIMSDGSDKLRLRDPVSFAVVGTLAVTGAGRKWQNLNELEYAQELIWANVWQDNRILAIHPDSGEVQGILDLTDLATVNSTRPGHSVLNGIAYDPARKAFWITGKLWPRRYLLEIYWPESKTSGNLHE